jgi:hypothetical protein
MNTNTNVNANTNIKVLGQGKDGIVIKPPLLCDGLNINYSNFIGKIPSAYKKDINFQELKDKIDDLPDEFDGIAYYKENYICDTINIEELPLSDNLKKKFVPKQHVLRNVEGVKLYDILEEFIYINERDINKYIDMIKATKTLYDILNKMIEQKVFYNDFSITNIIYNAKTKKLILIDLDDISYGTPLKIHKSVYFNDRTQTYNPNYEIEGNYAYIKYPDAYLLNYLSNILQPIIETMLLGKESNFHDEQIQDVNNYDSSMYQRRQKILSEYGDFTKSKLTMNEYQILYDNLDEIKDQLEARRGGRKKLKKSKKSKKLKSRKLRKKQVSIKYKKSLKNKRLYTIGLN